MELFQVIFTRRSIRQYKSDPVGQNNIKLILQAAMAAPSAHNHQPWCFIIISDPDTLDRIRAFHPYAEMLSSAPVAILVCGDKRIEPNSGYLTQDCAAATQNMLLAAHDIGLGSVWIGIYPKEERMARTAEIVQLPEHILPVSLVALGVPGQIKPRQDRFKPERIHKNSWGKKYEDFET